MKFIIYIGPHVMVGKRLQITDTVQKIYDMTPSIEEIYFRCTLLDPKKLISHYFPIDVGEVCLYTHKTHIVQNTHNDRFEEKLTNISIIILTFITFMLGMSLLLRQDQI